MAITITTVAGEFVLPDQPEPGARAETKAEPEHGHAQGAREQKRDGPSDGTRKGRRDNAKAKKRRGSDKGQGRKGQEGATYSQIWSTVPRVAFTAELTTLEVCILIALMRNQTKPGGGLVARLAEDIAEETGAATPSVRRALTRMLKKSYTAPDGTTAPVLMRAKPSGKRRAAVYRLGFPRDWSDPLPECNV